MTETSGKGKPSRKGNRKSKLFIFIVCLTVVVVGGALLFAAPMVFKPAQGDAVVHIPKDASLDEIVDSVSKDLGKEYASAVAKVARLRNSDFSRRHGAYLIPAGTSPLRAERILSQGMQHPLTVTVNGFRSLPLLAERLSRRLDFPADSLTAYLSRPDVTASYGLTPQQALSLFIDDSYQVWWSASPAALTEKIGAHYNHVWNTDRKEKAAKLGLSPAQIMTICSIVDEETNKIEDKGTIGRIYINRLKTGMPLQSCPTIRFALGDYTIKRVTGAHLKVDSPYNTYMHRGLPPGPIRTTSVATIDAVLDSEPNDYLYMCAREDFSGFHNFSSTYKEHLENARRYQKALDNRGIK